MAYGIRTTTDSRFYELSCKLPTLINTKDKPIVLQYSLKYEQNIECGGGYIKLLGTDYKPEEFNPNTRALIMFGPDICGEENKIHLMLELKVKVNYGAKLLLLLPII
jgi:calreticulin